MKHLSIILLLFVIACNSADKESKKLTPLSDLEVVSSEPVVTDKELLHSFTLLKDSIRIRTGSGHKAVSYDAIGTYLVGNKTELTKQRLNLVVTKEATHQSVVDVLDQMTIHQIKDFQVFQSGL